MEKLYEMPEVKTAYGVMPAHLIVVKNSREENEALHLGGRDVSWDSAAWNELDRQEADNYGD
jgi:hypothetical protein